MNIKEIVLEKIKATGADGLCGYDCGCGGEDLFWCAEPVPIDCELARRVLIKDHCNPEDCEACHISCDGYGEACITDAKMYVPFKEGGQQ